MKNIYIYGAGGMAKVIFDTAELLNINVLGFIDDTIKENSSLFDKPVLNEIPKNKSDFSVICGIGNCKIRKQIYERLLNDNYKFETIIHPSAIVSKHSIIGKGVYIGANAIIDPCVEIRDFNIINNGSIICHDTVINETCHIAPNCAIASNVTIGKYTWIGIGTTIKEKIIIENSAFIGAGSVLISNVSENSLVYGVPAKQHFKK